MFRFLSTSDDDGSRVLEHALPFEAMFDELRVVRASQFADGVGRALFLEEEWKAMCAADLPQARVEAETRLQGALATHKAAYATLAGQRTPQQLTKAAAGLGPVDLNAMESACWDADQPLKRVLHQLRGNAVAFSGGGIRSASFSLGVLQGLARFTYAEASEPQLGPLSKNGLMQDVHYVSTVSGGGYLGSWFSSWIARVAQRSAQPKGPVSEASVQAAYQKVMLALAGNLKQTSGDPVSEPVRHLRQFTSYLSPRFGFSLDSFTLAAIVLRNLVVNWIMLAPVLLAMLTLPQFCVSALHETSIITHRLDDSWFFISVGVLIAVSAFAAGRSLPSYVAKVERTTGRFRRRLNATGVAMYFLLPILGVCWLLSAHFYPGSLHDDGDPWDAATLAAVAGVGFCTLGLLKFWSYRHARKVYGPKHPPAISARRAISLLLLVTVLVSVLTGVGLELIGTRLLPGLTLWHLEQASTLVHERSYVIASMPAFLAVLILGSTLFSALTQQIESEEDREWWSRTGGMLITAGLLWAAGTALAMYAFMWDDQWTSAIGSSLLPSLGIGIGGLTSVVAKSSVTPSGARPEQRSDTGSISSLLKRTDLIMPALALLSLTLIAVWLVRLAERLRHHLPLSHRSVASYLLLLVVLLAAGGVVNWIININVFSLHGLYRMRLMRAFLGASNTSRNPDPFTGFDDKDTLNMCDLPKAEGVPLHILGTTLNLVGTKRAEWRQRKAESFTFSAVSAGAWRLNYLPSSVYGGTDGVSLATAMAISGAAANPNMGYHSSPLVGLLMTLFNARLGWWLPNPSYPLREGFSGAKAAKFLRQTSPTSGVAPLIAELFGKTNDDGKWIELSDGGHFDDLGLYEMVMRRVKNIIVVDSGADADYHFEDLGNALRKIEIDLGIPIRFPNGLNMQKGSLPENRYCAVAEIDYSCVDGSCFSDKSFNNPNSPSMQGNLIYIKACLTGAEPMDVQEYSFSHPKFPHEPTGNQFFNEAKFESYRHLGSSVLETLERASKGRTWSDFLSAARQTSAIDTEAESPTSHTC